LLVPAFVQLGRGQLRRRRPLRSRVGGGCVRPADLVLTLPRRCGVCLLDGAVLLGNALEVLLGLLDGLGLCDLWDVELVHRHVYEQTSHRSSFRASTCARSWGINLRPVSVTVVTGGRAT